MGKDFEEFNSINELDKSSQDLIHQAEEALALSYSPYSNFTVGAAALLKDGRIIVGANQENASYPAGLCAERVVLFQAGAVAPNEEISKLAVVAKKRDAEKLKGAGPCGFCRQVMLEFEQKQQGTIEIIFYSEEGKWIKTNSAAMLLPFSFGSKNLL